MNPCQIELESRRLKASKVRIKKRIKKQKRIIFRYWWKNMLKVLAGEASKGYKKKTNQIQNNQILWINVHH